MRATTDEQKQTLENLSAEGLPKNLPIQPAEKDIHVIELHSALSALKVKHDLIGDLDKRKENERHDAGIHLVFTGGTPNGELRERYTTQLPPLIYGIDPPTHNASFSVFEQVARDLLSASSLP